MGAMKTMKSMKSQKAMKAMKAMTATGAMKKPACRPRGRPVVPGACIRGYYTNHVPPPGMRRTIRVWKPR